MTATPTVYETTLVLGVQMKMIMLIQHTEKKDNSSAKRYEMSKWSLGNGIAKTPFTHFISLSRPADELPFFSAS